MEIDQQRLAPDAAFAELGRIVLGSQSLDETLRYVAELVRRTMPEIDEVSVTLMDGGTARTAVFTGPLAVQLDERQYEAGFGPCLDAAATGETIIVDVAADNSDYPDFASACLRSGITHTASVDCRYRSASSVHLTCTVRRPIRRTRSRWHGYKVSLCTQESP